MDEDYQIQELPNSLIDEINLTEDRHSERAIIIHGAHALTEPKLNYEVVRRVVFNLATGSTKSVAARAAGVRRRQLYRWEDIAEESRTLVDAGQPITEHQQMCLYFDEMVKSAEAGTELALLQTVLRGGETGAKWILARRYPERWAQKHAPVQHEHTGTIHLTWGDNESVIMDGEFTESAVESEVPLLQSGSESDRA